MAKTDTNLKKNMIEMPNLNKVGECLRAGLLLEEVKEAEITQISIKGNWSIPLI